MTKLDDGFDCTGLNHLLDVILWRTGPLRPRTSWKRDEAERCGRDTTPGPKEKPVNCTGEKEEEKMSPRMFWLKVINLLISQQAIGRDSHVEMSGCFWDVKAFQLLLYYFQTALPLLQNPDFSSEGNRKASFGGKTRGIA